MEFVELLIIFAVSIMLSNVINRIIPNVPAPIIQIFFGVLIGLTQWGQTINFEPELFLVMIIAPLLFREGEKADVPAILKNFGTIIFLAFGGVLLTLAGVGLTLSVLMPSIPLAACFAFGAALGPTDAVAVGSLSKRMNLPHKALHILEGEGLLNDASGVTAFQFALAALITGTFSILNAGVSLVFASIGGAVVGFVLVWIKRRLIGMIERVSAKDVASYLLIELLLPFIAYILAEVFHVSGIIAVVVAGVLQAAEFRKISLFEAELSSLSESTWTTISFTLNALVFIFLGIELTQVFSPVWENEIYPNWFLLVVILVISLMLFFIRFVSLSVFYLIRDGAKNMKKQMNEILILTFGGVKGTISLATIFILPFSINQLEFHQRSLLLFLTAGVILVTLLIGILILPFLTEDEEVIENPDFNELIILEEVILELKKDLAYYPKDAKEYIAIEAVIDNYQERLRELYLQELSEDEKREVQEIQALIISIERDGLDENYQHQNIGNAAFRFYYFYIARYQKTLTQQLLSFMSFWFIFVKRIIRIITHPKMFWERRKNSKEMLITQADIEEVRNVYLENTKLILESLENLKDVYGDTMIEFFINERKIQSEKMLSGNFISTILVQQETIFTKQMLRGYYLERKVIDEYEVSEKITIFSANEYRGRVNLLESYAMSQVSNTPSLTAVLNRSKKKEKKKL
ncbi:MAG: cation:proton antiporter [Enterococcus sp.]